MRNFSGLLVLAVGIVLVIWGINASQSTSSEISKIFTGAATNKAIYLIVGGAIAAAAGASIAFTGRGKQA